MSYPKVAQFKDVDAFRRRLAELQIDLPVDDRILTAAEGSPLAEPISIGPYRVGHRWCISHGRLGRKPRWFPFGAHVAALAAVSRGIDKWLWFVEA